MKVLVVCSRPSVQDGLGERLMQLVPGTTLLQAFHLGAAEEYLASSRHSDISVIVLDASTPRNAGSVMSTATTTYHSFLVRNIDSLPPIVGIASDPHHLDLMVGCGCVAGDINDIGSLAQTVLTARSVG